MVRGVLQYKCPKRIVAAWERISKQEGVHSFLGNGSPYHLTSEQLLSNISVSGVWGFCEGGEKLHIWYDAKKGSFEELLKTVAHEVGHTLPPYHPLKYEEVNACAIETTMHQIYKLTLRLWGNARNNFKQLDGTENLY